MKPKKTGKTLTVKGNKNKKIPAKQTDISNILGIVIIIFAIYFFIDNTVGFNFMPEVTHSMGYGLLFTVGFLTSLHCVAMCGGINLSQCVSDKFDKDDNLSKLKPGLFYNSGRIISYTLIGGMAGALGSVISLSGSAKGMVAIIAGGFMLIMGLNMLNIFPFLRKLTPIMPRIFSNENNIKKGPFYVGLLNGLMPCGPLQTMQIYALGTGSFLSGALSMFIFSMGTVPLMFGLGAASSMLSGKFTQKMMKVSGVLVMVLGLGMLNNGLSLSGINAISFNLPFIGESGSKTATASVSSDMQHITTEISSGSYPPVIVQKGLPVKWIIKATSDTLNGCNNPIIIPQYNIEFKLKPGDNLIEFTPGETGIIPYSCWMGMIRSKITIVDKINI